MAQFETTDPLIRMNTELMSEALQRSVDIAFTSGAAVAFGVVAMAEEISRKTHLHACPMCRKASTSRVFKTYKQPHPFPLGWVCMPCFKEYEATERHGEGER